MEPMFTNPEPPRYSAKPFPPYRHIPHQTPHPLLDPEGHSYGEEDEYLVEFGAEIWQTCEPYRYGVDLFNHGYWWEAHEAFEQLWLVAGRNSETGIFVQGLIQIAAAQLKKFMQQPAGAESLAAAGIPKIQVKSPIFLGIEIAAFCAEVQQSLQDDDSPYARIRLVEIEPESRNSPGKD